MQVGLASVHSLVYLCVSDIKVCACSIYLVLVGVFSYSLTVNCSIFLCGSCVWLLKAREMDCPYILMSIYVHSDAQTGIHDRIAD
jgi:hypothetical protein